MKRHRAIKSSFSKERLHKRREEIVHRLKNMWNNISLRRKFFSVYTFCVAVPVLVGAFIWSAFTSNLVRENELRRLSDAFDDVSAEFSSLTDTSMNIAVQISVDDTMFRDLSRRFSTYDEHYRIYYDSLRGRFANYLTSNSSIANITFYTYDRNFINCDYFRVVDDQVRQTDWYRFTQSGEFSASRGGIYPGSTSISVLPGANRVTLINEVRYSRYMNNAPNYLLIEMDFSQTIDKLMHTDDMWRVSILQADGNSLWDKPGAAVGTPDGDEIVFTKEVGVIGPYGGWKLVGALDDSLLDTEQYRVLSVIIAATLVFAGLGMLLLWPMLGSMRTRLTLLAGHMRGIDEGAFNSFDMNPPGQDEIGWLIVAFNDMIAKINSLVNDVYVLEVQKKDMELENTRAEYKYLQAQIDPHFLFNTLNAILVFSVKNGYTELSAILGNLSKLLKRLVRGGNDIVPLTEELDFIEKYLSIEKFRFGDRLDYSIRISQEVEERQVTIPKMTIQPIVENACKHGLQAIRGGRKLLVSAVIEDDALVIAVEDNGVGIGKDAYAAITESFGAAEPRAGGIGLQNVFRRMKIYYGDSFSLSIGKPVSGEGARVVIRVEQNQDGR